MIFFPLSANKQEYNLGDIILVKFSQQGSEYVVEYVDKFEYSGLPLTPHILLNILANGLRSLWWIDKNSYVLFKQDFPVVNSWKT